MYPNGKKYFSWGVYTPELLWTQILEICQILPEKASAKYLIVGSEAAKFEAVINILSD